MGWDMAACSPSVRRFPADPFSHRILLNLILLNLETTT